MFWRELNLSTLEWVGIMSWLEAAGARWCRGGWRGKTGNERPRWAEDESKTENGARVVALPRRPASRMQKSEDELTSKYCRMGRVEGGSRREGSSVSAQWLEKALDLHASVRCIPMLL